MMCLSMVVQILSWIHREQLFFSINEKPSLTRILTQDPLEKFTKTLLYHLSYLAFFIEMYTSASSK